MRMFKNRIIIFLLVLGWAACSPVEKNPLRFALLTDLHLTPGAESSDQLAEMVKEINASDLDMVVITGDLTNRGSYKELRNVKNILDQLEKEYLILPGNHETNWSETASNTFSELFGEDKFLVKYGSYLLVGLNTGPFMRMGDGHILQQDLVWLEEQLQAHMKPGMTLLFFAHYPLAEGLDQWYVVTDILQRHNAAAAFCGHGHRQQLLNFDGIPGIMGRSMVLRGENIPGYNIVEIRNDSLWVFEKETGNPLEKPNIGFALYEETVLEGLPVSPLPDFSANDQHAHIRPEFIWQDENSVFSGPLVLKDTLLIYGNSAAEVMAVDLRKNHTIWKRSLQNKIFATPVWTKHSIVISDTRGIVYALHPETGDILWKKDIGSAIVAPALASDPYIYLGAGTSGMYKLDARNGQLVWHFDQVEGLIQALPALHENYLVFTVWDTHLYCLNAQTGQLKWKWNNQRPVALLSPGNVVPVISHGKVFIVAPDRYMTAIDLASGKQLWRTHKHQVRESMGVSPDGTQVFAKLMNDTVVSVCATSQNFKTLWAVDAGFGYDHNPCPIVADSHTLFTATRNGLVIALDTESQKVLWKHKTGNSAVNFLHLNEHDGLLWFSTTDGSIIALPQK